MGEQDRDRAARLALSVAEGFNVVTLLTCPDPLARYATVAPGRDLRADALSAIRNLRQAQGLLSGVKQPKGGEAERFLGVAEALARMEAMLDTSSFSEVREKLAEEANVVLRAIGVRE